MAQQQPAAPPAPQPPPLLQHFWDDNCASRQLIAELYQKGLHYPYEDIVADTWMHICMVYFHAFTTTGTGGPFWSVRREAYRGLPPARLSTVRPDVTTIRVTQAQPTQGPPQYQKRDYLWVECKAAKLDVPHGWRTVLDESVDRLSVAHPNRPVFLVIGVGYKCMWFVWDPLNQGPAQPQFYIQRANKTGTWLIDARIKTFQPTAWANLTTGELVCENATELECWTTVQVGGQNILQNINNLTMLERFLISVRSTVLPGLNPPAF